MKAPLLAIVALTVLAAGGCMPVNCPHGMYEVRGADGLRQYHCITASPPATAAHRSKP